MSELIDPHLSIRFITNKELTLVGTCFAVSKNKYLTAKHVVNGCDALFITDKRNIDVLGKNSNYDLVPVDVIWESDLFDLAAISPREPQGHTDTDLVFKKPSATRIPLNTTISSIGYPLPEKMPTTDKISKIIQRSFVGNVTTAYEGEWYGKAHPLLEVSFPILKGHSGSPLMVHTTPFEISLIGVCLGQSEFYTEEKNETETVGGNREVIYKSGWRFGICIDLIEVLKKEPSASLLFES